ncbi:MAG: hypothetical protein JNJ45_08205 [Chthonomonas sp.]|nr:hypothetical protein [Chthonomonas sp.]
MTILILDDNLLWTSRLTRSAQALGHSPTVAKTLPAARFDVAILNLGRPEFSSPQVIGELRGRGTYLIGHAGHKEKDLLNEGTANGVDQVVSNSSLTFKLADILAKIPSDFSPPARLN